MAETPRQAGASFIDYAELPVQGARIGLFEGIPDLFQTLAGTLAEGGLGAEAALESQLTGKPLEEIALRNAAILKASERMMNLPNYFSEPPTGVATAVEDLIESRPDLKAAMTGGPTMSLPLFGDFTVGEALFNAPLTVAKYSPLAAAPFTLATEMGIGAGLGASEAINEQLDLSDLKRFDVGGIGQAAAIGALGGATGYGIGKGIQAIAPKVQTAGKQYLEKLKEAVRSRSTNHAQNRVQSMQNASKARYKAFANKQAPRQVEAPEQVEVKGQTAGPGRPVSETEIQVLKARQERLKSQGRTAEEAQELLPEIRKKLAEMENQPATIEDAALASRYMETLDNVNKGIQGSKAQRVEVEGRLDEVKKSAERVSETISERKKEISDLKKEKISTNKEIKRLKGIKSKRNAKQRPKQIADLEKEVKSIDRKIKTKEDSIAKREAELDEWKKDEEILTRSMNKLDENIRGLNEGYEATVDQLNEALGIKQKQEAIAELRNQVQALENYIEESQKGLPLTNYEKEIIENVKRLRETNPEYYEAVIERVTSDAQLRKQQIEADVEPGPGQKMTEEAEVYAEAPAKSWLNMMGGDKLASIYRKGVDGSMFLRKIGAKSIANSLDEWANSKGVFQKLYRDALKASTGLSFKQFKQVLGTVPKQAILDGTWDNLTPLQQKALKANEAILGQVYDYLQTAGVELPKRIKNFFPRRRQPFSKLLDKLEKLGLIDETDKVALKEGFNQRAERSIETEDAIVGQLLQERKIDVVPSEMRDLYLDPVDALERYLNETANQYGLTRMYKGQKLNQSIEALNREKVARALESGEIDPLQGAQALKALNETFAPNQYSALEATARDIINMSVLSGPRTALVQLTAIPRAMSRFDMGSALGALKDALKGKSALDLEDFGYSMLNDIETNEGVLNLIRDKVLLPFNLANKFEASMTLNAAYKWLKKNAAIKLKKGRGTTNFERFLEQQTDLDPAALNTILKKLAAGEKLDGNTLNVVLSAARNVGGLALTKADKVPVANKTIWKQAFALKTFQIKNANILLDRTVGEARRDVANAIGNTIKTAAFEIAPTAMLGSWLLGKATDGMASGAEYVGELTDTILESIIPHYNQFMVDQIGEGRDMMKLVVDLARPGLSSTVKIGSEAWKLRESPLSILDPEVNPAFRYLPARWITEPIYEQTERRDYDLAARYSRTDPLAKEMSEEKVKKDLLNYGLDPAGYKDPRVKEELKRLKAKESSFKRYGTTNPKLKAQTQRIEKRAEYYKTYYRNELARRVRAGKLSREQAIRYYRQIEQGPIVELVKRDMSNLGR